MDQVVKDALAAVTRAQAALDHAEIQLREAWAQRLVAFRTAGWTVAYVHETHGIPISQALVVEDEHGDMVNLERLIAEAQT
jgi:hypothetical protein